MIGGPNPVQARDVQQAFQIRGAAAAKNAKPLSSKKLLMILVPVFLLVLALVLLGSGAFERGYTVILDGSEYAVKENMKTWELPEGCVLLGETVYSETPTKEMAPLFSDWPYTSRVYWDPADSRFAYMTSPNAGGNYVTLKKRSLLSALF